MIPKTIAALLLGAPLLYFGAVFAAGELGGEVAVLHRADADGGTTKVRVWVVESDGALLIEHGEAADFWQKRLHKNPEVQLARGDALRTYRATPAPELHAHYHALRRARYGWADAVVEFAGAAACTGAPVRLAPAN